MTDPFEESVARLGAPRPLDPAFRARLERAMTGFGVEPADERWRIDGPRAPAPGFRDRLESGLTSPPRGSRSLLRFIAAAAVMVLAAGATIVVVDRLGAPNQATANRPIVSPSPSPVPPPETTRPKGSLQGFRSSQAFLSYVRGQALQLIGPYGFGVSGTYYGGAFPVPATRGGAAAGVGSAPQPAAPVVNTGLGSHSSTNIQEEGVDEPDTVKTDGRRLIVLSGSDVRVIEVKNGTAYLRGTVRILNGIGVFLDGDKVIHFASLPQAPPAAARATHAKFRPWTKVSVIDIGELDRPRVVSSMSVEGNFVGARLARGVVRLIVQSGALGPAPVPIRTGSNTEISRAEALNKQQIRVSSVGDWVPHFVVSRSGRRASTGHVHDWRAVSRPPDKAGLSMLTLLTIDPDDPRPDNATSVVGAGDVIYSSLDNLYVTSGRLDDVIALRSGKAPKGPITRIHKFDVRDPLRATYRGSGEVPGMLLNQFSLSEYDGYLRVATTVDPSFVTGGPGASTSSVFVMKERAGRLEVTGSIGKLGVGERIYSVRFVGSKGYVVTFRQIDPLFVIDLRVPSRPRLAGQLKVPGYSGYLHPLSERLLLGVGQAADSRGRVGGVQLSLFDVSNPQRPRRLDVETIGEHGSSEVTSDHHSFLYWERRRLAVVPMESFGTDGDELFYGAIAVRIGSNSTFGSPIRITHLGRPHTEGADVLIHRSLVIDDRLITISNAGILLSDLATLQARRWVPFQD
jgi:uncharacterized secreted protein with C-terminal beta-propeller domain